MQTHCVSPVATTSQKTTFKAHIPYDLHVELYNIAESKGAEMLDTFCKQVCNINGWGNDGYSGIKKAGKKLFLANRFGKPKSVKLPKKETLFESFMTLTKEDIVKAEKDLHLFS